MGQDVPAVTLNPRTPADWNAGVTLRVDVFHILALVAAAAAVVEEAARDLLAKEESADLNMVLDISGC
jgi:hypothetical protein